MDKIFYTISQTASLVGESSTTIRFWSNRFSKFIDPKRNAKGNRLFRSEDLEVLKRISHFTRECGLSLEATERKLRQGSLSEDDKLQQISESLTRIREQLAQIRESL